MGKFLSEDPLSKSYPELTPYQFASNTPISGIDRDGLEYYYNSDGVKIGSIDGSTEVRRMNSDVTLSQAQNIFSKAHNNPYTMNANSTDVGMTNAELNVRALLTTIRKTEGHGVLTPYNKRYGGFTFDPAKGHPGTFLFKELQLDKNGNIKRGIDGKALTHMVPHSPAGAFQITEPTFNGYKKAWGLTNFLPPVQERVAMEKIKDRNAFYDVETGNWNMAIPKLKNEWSSFPGGKGQAMTLDEILQEIQNNIRNEINDKSSLATPKGKLVPNKP